MNWYEHHIGDYAEATDHLSWLEDMAYTRMIRKYYATEKPLPADVAKVQRLVRAQTKAQKQAVLSVLEEFFFLEADGWHNARCDEDLAKYHASEPEREAKKANKEEREHRHREERAKLFERLRFTGIHAPWNEKIDVLRDLVAKHCAAPTAPADAVAAATPTTGPVTQPATAPSTPATATQSPPPTTQVDDDERASVGGTVDKSGAQPFDDPSAPQTVSEWAAFFADEQSTRNADTSDEFAELSRHWIAAGVTRGRMRQACARGRALATKPISYLPSYVDSVLATLDAPLKLPKAAEARPARAAGTAAPAQGGCATPNYAETKRAEQPPQTPEEREAARIARERELAEMARRGIGAKACRARVGGVAA